MLFFFQSVGQENWASRVKRMLYVNGFGYVDIRQNFIPAKFYTTPKKHKVYVLMATRSDRYV